MRVRLGTRGSRLAVIQAEEVASALRAQGAEVEIVTIRTSGDRLAHVALADFGGKALFVKEVEEALLDGRVDVGVHSLKDMPASLPDGLCLAAFPPRQDPADGLVTRSGGTLADLPAGAVVGTSSVRRSVLLHRVRPDLQAEPIRGNVDTRVSKLIEGRYDALVLALAGLARLRLSLEHVERLPPDVFLPAPGQGVLGVEARESDARVLELLRGLDHTETRIQAEAERAFLQHLGADCHTAVGGLARLAGDTLTVVGMVASPDGASVLSASVTGGASTPERLGCELAEELLARGASAILGLRQPRSLSE